MKTSIAFILIFVCAAFSSFSAEEYFSYCPEEKSGDISIHVDSWRALSVEWDGIPLLAEAGVLYSPGYYTENGSAIGQYPLEELRLSRDVPVRVEVDGARRIFTWRSFDEEWGIEQINRAELDGGVVIFESSIVFSKKVPAHVLQHPVFLPARRNNYKEAQSDPQILQSQLVFTDADHSVFKSRYLPREEKTFGGKLRKFRVESPKGAIEYTFESSDPDFSSSLKTGEVWPHFRSVIGAEGIVGVFSFRPDDKRSVSWKITVVTPGARTVAVQEKEKPEYCHMHITLPRDPAFFYPDEAVKMKMSIPVPFSGAGLSLKAVLRNYENEVVRTEEFKSLKADTIWEWKDLPVGIYALSATLVRHGKPVGFSSVRFGVTPKLVPYPGEKSFFGSFQCYEPFTEEKIALNRYVGIGMVRFRDGKQGEFWRVSEPAAGQWIPNELGIRIAEAYRKAGIAMWYTGDQYPPSIVEFSSNDKSVREPFPAGLTADQVDFFHYHSTRRKDGFLPKDGNIYRSFVSRYVRQFPMIQRYEIMNEPFPAMDVEAAARVIEWTTEAIRSIHPNAQTQSPGISQLLPDQLDWTDRVLAAGAAKHLSFLSYHNYIGRTWVKLDSESYFPPIETLGYEKKLRQVAAIARKHSLPMCNSEMTWMGSRKETWPSPEFHSAEKNTTETYVRSYLLEKAAGAESVTLCFGSTIRSASLDYNITVERGAAFLGMRRMVKPWAVAHAVLADLMEGAEYLGNVPQKLETTRLLRFKGRSGDWAALWNYAEKCNVALPFAPGEAEYLTITGGRIVPGGNMLPIGSSPVYIRNLKLTSGQFAEALGKINVKSQGGASIKRIFIERGSHQTLHVVIDNRGEDEAEISFLGYKNSNPDIVPCRKDFRIPPGESTVRLPVRLASTVPMTIDMELRGTSGGNAFYDRHEATMSLPSAATAQRIGALPVFPGTPAIGGGGDEAWDKAPWIILEEAKYVGTDAGREIDWRGPEDLSCRAKVLWDRNYFYFHAEVTDDVHHNNQQEASIASWAGDSIQMAFDLRMDSAGGYNADDHEINAADWRGKAVMWHRIPFGEPLKGGKIAVKRVDGVTRYDIAVPLKELTPWEGESPVGRLIRFNFIVNDDDGKETRRTKWIGLTPGLGEAKNPKLYRQFLFVD